MDIAILETFCKVAKTKNFQKAADELYISQPSVINRIRLLEKEISHKLFYRHGRGIELTSKGQQFVAYVEKMLTLLNEGAQEVANMKHSSSMIKIASFPTATSYLLPKYLQWFKKEHPDVEVHVQTAYSATIIDWVSNGVVEIGMVQSPFRHNKMNSVKISSDPIVLVTHSSHPWVGRDFVTPTDFRNETLLPVNRKTLEWAAISDWFERHHVQPIIGLEFDHLEMIKQMVLQNFGVAFIPSAVVGNSASSEQLKVVPVEPPLNLFRETCLINNKQKPLTSEARKLWDLISDVWSTPRSI